MSFDVISFEKTIIDGGFTDANGNKFIGAKILINGESLLDKVKTIETPFAAAEKHIDIAGNYSYQIAKNLYNYLTIEDYWNDEGGVALFTCTCLEDGCWSLRCYINETDTTVIWHNFHHEHRDNWDYKALEEFCFDKQQYINELEKLKTFIE
jgi:hypothetical protein